MKRDKRDKRDKSMATSKRNIISNNLQIKLGKDNNENKKKDNLLTKHQKNKKRSWSLKENLKK